MIKAFAVILLIAATGSSISEFTLSVHESFTLHFDQDYVFSVSECGSTCISLRVSQLIDGKTTWTGQLFDLQAQQMYPLDMAFEDVVFDSVYVVSAGETITLRVSYREVAPAMSNERLVKAASEKETVETVSVFILLELGAVIFLIFFVAHRIFHKKSGGEHGPGGTPQVPENVPTPALGFHDQYYWPPGTGIPRQEEEDTDLELLQHIREMEELQEMEMQRRKRRRLDEEDTLGLEWI